VIDKAQQALEKRRLQEIAVAREKFRRDLRVVEAAAGGRCRMRQFTTRTCKSLTSPSSSKSGRGRGSRRCAASGVQHGGGLHIFGSWSRDLLEG
jgi:hypothetical protein